MDYNTAHGLRGTAVSGGAGMAKAASCTPSISLIEIKYNNVRTLLTTSGLLWYDKAKNKAAYEVPKTPDFSGPKAIYSGGLWMGGLSPDNQLKIAAIRYRELRWSLRQRVDTSCGAATFLAFRLDPPDPDADAATSRFPATANRFAPCRSTNGPVATIPTTSPTNVTAPIRPSCSLERCPRSTWSLVRNTGMKLTAIARLIMAA
jgi:hypothetical protein